MRNFDYAVANRVDEAFSIDGGQTMAIAGGTELLNWFRLGIAAPDKIVDIGRIAGLEAIERSGARISIGALATLNQIGENAIVREHAAVLADAWLTAAPPSVRHRATIICNGSQTAGSSYFRVAEQL